MPRLIWAALIVLALLATSWMTRGYLARKLPPLKPWHSAQLDAEFRARDFPAGISFNDYQALEAELVRQMAERISQQLSPQDRAVSNRYDPNSPAHPDNWGQNWNLSFELPRPDPTGAIVLLHGASDSPYSLRALAMRFSAAGLHVIVPRLPGNGTLPGELLKVHSEDWTAITHMAVARAHDLVGERPVFIGGYSTGAALALQHSLRAVRDQTQIVDGLFFFSPAIGITGFAALAQWDVLLSRVPLFQKFAWMTIWPEYDPFKYSSFPKQAGHLVHAITQDNATAITQLKGTPGWSALPPIITFQSIVDETVDVDALVDFYADLAPNGHQLVLFDVNRSSITVPFLEQDGRTILQSIANGRLTAHDVTVVGNLDAGNDAVVARRSCNAEPACQQHQQLTHNWPFNVYSLSHVAIPFPPEDPLYGADDADPAPNGYNLGRLAPKGERQVLVIPAEDLNRLRYNPFFDYVAARTLGFCSACTGAQP